MSRILAFLASLVVLLTAIAVVYLFGGKYVGWAKAHYDLSRGDFCVVVMGLPPFWDKELTRVYGEKYHIRRDRITACIVSPWDEGFESGYNSVSIPAIQARYSNRVFIEAEREAILEYIRVHKPQGNRAKYVQEALRMNAER